MKASVWLSRITVAIFSLLLLGLGILTLCLPKNEYSEAENRYLATLPTPTAEAILSGRYMKQVEEFASDHVPYRSLLLEGKCAGERLLFRTENNHVLFGKEGYLIKRLEWQDTPTFRENLSGALEIERLLEENGIPTTFVCAPRAIDVLGAYLPEHYPKTPFTEVATYLAQNAPTALFPASLLEERATGGEEVFFRTDHHWTPLGAYYIYEALGERIGYTPLPLSDFYVEVASESFVGTSASAAMTGRVIPDRILRYRYKGDGALTVTDVSTGEVKMGLYRDEFLSQKDKYASFLGGNFAHLRITDGDDRPRLLIIKDSYANCLVPFLARHYDIELVDLRYVREDAPAFLSALLTSEKFDRALLLFNVQSLSEGVGLASFARNIP